MGNLPRYTLSIGAAAAMLSGCGGSAIPIRATNNATGGVSTLKNHKIFDYTGQEANVRSPRGRQAAYRDRSRWRGQRRVLLVPDGGFNGGGSRGGFAKSRSGFGTIL